MYTVANGVYWQRCITKLAEYQTADEMKTLFLLFLLPLNVFAQNLEGVWIGNMRTEGTELAYELVISGSGQELRGYSLTVFSFQGVDNVGMKAMKFKNKKGTLTIEDGELLYNNYTTPPKKVKLIGTLTLQEKGSRFVLSGTFFTRSLDLRDKSSYSGSIYLEKQDDLSKTNLVSRLDEMELLSSLSFIQKSQVKKESTIAAPPVDNIAEPALKEVQRTFAKRSLSQTSINISSLTTINTRRVVPASAYEIIDYASPAVAKETHLKVAVRTLKKAEPVLAVVNKSRKIVPPSAYEIIDQASPTEPRARSIASAPTEVPGEITRTTSTSTPKTIVPAPASNPGSKPATKSLPALVPPVAAAAVYQRKTEVISSVPFTSDSLVLSLYDNGSIDGDTVSVVLNGKVIIARKGLTTNAIRAIIQVTPEMGDSLQLIMYAENLGSIAPNTGLLIVQDGDKRHEIRFSGDMQKSSAIIFRRQRS